MKYNERKFLFLTLALLALFASSAIAQDAKDLTPAPIAAVGEQVDETMRSEDLSIYGEIQLVDAKAGSLIVQYYDYDTDEEKTITIAIDADSKLENAQTIADIKKGDWADVTYSLVGDKNIARSVIVEKEEEPVAPAVTEQAAGQAQATVKAQADAQDQPMDAGDETY